MPQPPASRTPRMERIHTTLVISLPEHLPADAVPALREELETIIRADGLRQVVFNLEAAEFMDSSGIGLLVSAKRLATESRQRLYVYKPGTQVMKALGLVHLANAFTIVHEEQELNALLQPAQ